MHASAAAPALGVFNAMPIARIHSGRPAAEVIVEEATAVGANSVLVVASGTLARQTQIPGSLANALGPRYGATFSALSAHSPREDVIAGADAARACQADLIVSVGGGSVIDGAKMIAFALANDIRSLADFDPFYTRVHPDGSTETPPCTAPVVRQIAIPTTLSAAEFNVTAGCTDTANHRKQSYRHPLLAPLAIVLDPEIALATPLDLWLSTGMRAVDHAMEDLCSKAPHPYVDGAAIHALRLLAPALRATKRDPGNVAARLDAQIGAWLSMTGAAFKIPRGASHAVGRTMGGAVGVPHGHTSCVLMPAVLRYNLTVNAARQELVSTALDVPDTPAADAIASLVRDLGQPGTLRDLSVRRDQFQEIAEKSLLDRGLYGNPRPIEGAGSVLEILELAW